MNERVSNALMVVSVICAVTIAGAVAKREFFPSAQSASVDGARVPRWEEYAQSKNSSGSVGAKIVFVEFFDFQCPACRRLAMSLDTIVERGTPVLRLVRRHFPLSSIHSRARELAIVGECVRRQGEFSAYYRNVFNAQAATRAEEWTGAFALVPTGVDTSILRACLETGDAAAVVDADIAAGDRLGITGTPTFIVNGRRYSGLNRPGIAGGSKL